MSAPTIRLAHCDGAQGDNVLKADAPNVRLAHFPDSPADNALIGARGVARVPDTSAPALLVSFYYLRPFLEARDRYMIRDWALDSGAFSAHNSGATIDLDAYIAACKELLANDPQLVEVFSLDVIGDWKGSLANTEKMWAAGIPAIPCFHAEEPWEALKIMARDYPKIALGGVALARTGKKLQWARQCFARVWPKKIHGFAFGGRRAILELPFHSVDATSWESGPCMYGSWKSLGDLRIRGSRQNLRSEIEWYLRLEREARSRWAKEMALLETLPGPSSGPTIRLAEAVQRETQKQRRVESGLTAPDLRLALGGSPSGVQKKAREAALGPDLRLALSGSPTKNKSRKKTGLLS